MQIKTRRALAFAMALVASLGLLGAAPALAQTAAPPKLDSAGCLECHETSKKPIEVADKGGEKRALPHVDPAKFGKGVHAKVDCVACHTEIVDSKADHRKVEGAKKPDCASCHVKLWDEAKANPAGKERLGVVARNIEAYRQSFHAKPDTDNPDRPKATCHECHATHDFGVPRAGTPERTAWRVGIGDTCGNSCHEEQLETWSESHHGVKILKEGETKSATCIDCHSAHSIENTSLNVFKTTITKDCGSCHEQEFQSYRATLHGQINALGYGNSGKCFDCHGSHDIRKVDDPKSPVHADRREKTCSKCHDGKKASQFAAGFVSFPPHAHAGDFDKYPHVWIATWGMVGLLIGTFAFFWLHMLLWLYREIQERRTKGKVVKQHVNVAALGIPPGKHVRRFGKWERLGHLVFAVSLMILTLTGMTLMYSETAWAPVVVRMLGGPQVTAVIHRVNAVIFTSIFVIHLIWVAGFLWRNRRTFRLFGPDSVVPNWQDLKDVIAMFKWFLGKGERPKFDRWTYWEKFDYWAPFWGVTIVGVSGFIMWFPTLVATYLPGWVFNVAAITHGEEAFLAAVFLFTVHFFNNHFRPEKLPPPDVVMFTGTLSLDDFKHHHEKQYERLVASGELQKYLVDAPSKPMRTGSVVLGIVLIIAGLTLLVLVANGFFSAATH